MLHRAKLDHDGVYWGTEEVKKLGAGDVEVPAACDLRPGAYKFVPKNAEHDGRFEPLPKAAQKAAPGAPTLEQAFHAFVKSGYDAPRVKAWCEWYEKNVMGASSNKDKS
jgi:hypothetical protein